MSAEDGADTAPLSVAPSLREPSHAPSPRPQDAKAPAAAESMEVTPASEGPNPDTFESLPMTATGSTSSQFPPQENGEVDPNGSYGTRSRIRTGGARPNYAEDKELDMEIEATGLVRKSTSKKEKSLALPSNYIGTNGDAPVRSGFAAINSGSVGGQNRNVDHASTVSTSDDRATAPMSKKRKQPGSSTTVTAPASTNGVASRSRVAMATQSKSYVETNMLSFERSKARLNSRTQLVADDGTVLSTNGQSLRIWYPASY